MSDPTSKKNKQTKKKLSALTEAWSSFGCYMMAEAFWFVYYNYKPGQRNNDNSESSDKRTVWEQYKLKPFCPLLGGLSPLGHKLVQNVCFENVRCKEIVIM